VKISAPKKLSKEEIDKMVKDAEKYAEDDAKKKEEVEHVNQADQLIYATEKSLKEYGDKVSQEERVSIEAAVNDLKTAVKDKHIERIKKGMDALTKAAHKLAEEIYKQSAKAKPGAEGQAQPGTEKPTEEKGSEEPNPKKKDDDIIDADFKEEK
jgi:molecular chaperone DnaK